MAAKKSGGGEEEEEEEGEEEGDEEEGGGARAPSQADLDAAAAGGKQGAVARAEAALLTVPEFNNPLAGMPRPAGGAGGHREGDFFKALAKNAAEKKAAQEAEKAVRQPRTFGHRAQRFLERAFFTTPTSTRTQNRRQKLRA